MPDFEISILYGLPSENVQELHLSLWSFLRHFEDDSPIKSCSQLTSNG